MKKFFMTLALCGLFMVPAPEAKAWDVSYLNPLPYMGIGCNKTSFSLNPFTGFKNCNPCKCKVENKKDCDPCKERVSAKKCDSCTRAFPKQACSNCNTRYYYEY